MSKVCCVGLYPKEFAWDYADKNNDTYKEYLRFLKAEVERYILDGADRFMSILTSGAGADFAKIVIGFREKYPHIRLQVIRTCNNSRKNYPSMEDGLFETLVNNSNGFLPLDRVEDYIYMIEKCEKILVVWNASEKNTTYKAIKYAQKKNRNIRYVMLPSKSKRDIKKYYDLYVENPLCVQERKEKDDAWKKLIEIEKKMKNKR